MNKKVGPIVKVINKVHLDALNLYSYLQNHLVFHL